MSKFKLRVFDSKTNSISLLDVLTPITLEQILSIPDVQVKNNVIHYDCFYSFSDDPKIYTKGLEAETKLFELLNYSKFGVNLPFKNILNKKGELVS